MQEKQVLAKSKYAKNVKPPIKITWELKPVDIKIPVSNQTSPLRCLWKRAWLSYESQIPLAFENIEKHRVRGPGLTVKIDINIHPSLQRFSFRSTAVDY